ncbi:MAG: RAMP superfamily CRISPR-associated protein, partial [Pseudanabaenaceae cyanobacterium]
MATPNSGSPNKTEKRVIPDPKTKRKDESGGGNRENKGNGGANFPPSPSPWLDHPLHPNGTPPTHATASFVEYLRWMRSPQGKSQGKNFDPTTQLLLMQTAEEKANYQQRLEKLNMRTKLLAGANNWFEVTCPWRIRVGGTKGPESMLLPAFDALGMPYIPSSTLRGIARAYAIRHFMQEKKMNWGEADRHVEKWFGHLDGKDDNRSSKVIFLDAYPKPSKSGGLTIDMANSIWRWEGDQLGSYNPNPNAFFSLKNVSFLIGIRPIKPEYAEAAQQVQKWLMAGLAQGVGSQVNSGYGVLVTADRNQPVDQAFLELEFDVKGQKIHGAHRFSSIREPFRKRNGVLDTDREGNLKPNILPHAEVRATALKNMMRYWFRVFVRGVLPPRQSRTLEAKIFGGIEPEPIWGWLCVRVEEIDPSKDRPNIQNIQNIQSGRLRLFTTSSLPTNLTESFQVFCKELSWLMFRLGGVGQGARRPYY